MYCDNKTMVSIICNTYNQEDYIADAIESFLTQKTNFKYEILIHDDASTDRTAEIIREYERKYPLLIKPIYQNENQYSKDKEKIFEIQSRRAQGKYVAICEGDDYWTDPNKLQRQFNAMEQHEELDICSHDTSAVDAVTKKEVRRFGPSDEDVVFTAEQVIAGGGGFVATNSLFIRKDAYINKMNFRSFFNFDYSLQIQMSLRGGMLYLSDNMSAYRLTSKQSLTARMQQDVQAKIEWVKKVVEMLNILNTETNHRYSTVICERQTKLRFHILMWEQNYQQIFKEYREYISKMELKEKTRIYIKYIIYLLKGLIK